jgi:RHS repeat-associated protein
VVASRQRIKSLIITSQVATITDSQGITRFYYDERDRLTARKDPFGVYTSDGYSIEYAYDATGNRTAVETPSSTVTYRFDERNRLQSVTDADQQTTTYGYDAANRLVRTERPNGVVEIRQYNSVHQLQSLKNVKRVGGQEQILTRHDYELDKVGNRLSVIDHTGRQVKYDYDELYRLEQEQVLQGGTVVRTTEFDYDNVGNRLRQTQMSAAGTEMTTYQYDQNDRLEWEKVNGVLKTSYQYDANGNTTQKAEAGVGTTVYTWNQDGRMVAATTADGKQLAYSYDAQGIRTSSTVNGVTTTYLLDKNLPYAQVLEERVGGALTVSYVYGNDLISQERGSQTSYYLVDGLGSTTALTNAQGGLTDSYTYLAFGQLELQSGSTENSYRFAGEQYDAGLGDYYLRDRYYDAESGRFTRRDVYEGRQGEPLTLHKYLYAHANPAILTDPSGFLAGVGTLQDLAVLIVVTAILIEAHQIVTGLYNPEHPEGYGAGLQPVVPSHTGRRGIIGEVLDFGRTRGFGAGHQPSVPNSTANPGWDNTITGLANYVFSSARSWVEAGISSLDAERIQNVATSTKQRIVVIGSRAKGTNNLSSDWDYVLTGNSDQRRRAKKWLPRGTSGGEVDSNGRETGADFFDGYDPREPHVIFEP